MVHRMFLLGRNFLSGHLCTLKPKQESLANAKVSARQAWYTGIGRNSLNRPSLRNAKQYQRHLYIVEKYFRQFRPLASTPPGMQGTHPLQYFSWGSSMGISPSIITHFRTWKTNISRPRPMAAFSDVFCSLLCSKIQNLPQNQPEPH